MIAKDVAGTSVESMIKSWSRHKDACAKFLALISNHVVDTKYWAIVKSRRKIIQNIKWNGKNYPFYKHVSNQWTAIGDICNCATHIGNSAPNTTQKVELLLESINSQDNTLQSAMGNICANTNGLRGDF